MLVYPVRSVSLRWWWMGSDDQQYRHEPSIDKRKWVNVFCTSIYDVTNFDLEYRQNVVWKCSNESLPLTIRIMNRRSTDDYPKGVSYEKPPDGQYIVNTLMNAPLKLWSVNFGKDLANAMNIPAAPMPPMDVCPVPVSSFYPPH